jgi:RNA polymerase sigma-70 factor (ECF subfamily)
MVEAAKNGDRQAQKHLIEATQTRLFRFCMVLCGDQVKAEDLCQETYLKALANLGKLTKPEAFMSWLFQVCRNLAVDEGRKRRERAASAEEMDALEEPASSGFAEHHAVHQVLSQFEPEDRWLLILVDLEEHSYAEAAEVLGLTEDAVRSRLFRLRKEFVNKWNGRETK